MQVHVLSPSYFVLHASHIAINHTKLNRTMSLFIICMLCFFAEFIINRAVAARNY